MIFFINNNIYCQQKPLTYHAVQMQTILESSGFSKGWENVDLYVQFYITNSKLDSIIINKGKHIGVIIKELKSKYKIGNTFYDIYTGYDDVIAEDLEIRWELFSKNRTDEAGKLTIKYTDFTINIKLSNK